MAFHPEPLSQSILFRSGKGISWCKGLKYRVSRELYGRRVNNGQEYGNLESVAVVP